MTLTFNWTHDQMGALSCLVGADKALDRDTQTKT